MAKVTGYTYRKSPKIQGGKLQHIGSGVDVFAAQMKGATREHGEAINRFFGTVENAANSWAAQMAKLQMLDADTKLSKKYRERLFDTKTNNQLGKSIGVTERETQSLSEEDNEEFYNQYSPFLRMRLETLNARKQNQYLGQVQNFEITEAGRYEVKVVSSNLNEGVQQMIDAPIGNVNFLLDKAQEMRDNWSGQYPVKVQKAIDNGIVNAYQQWAWSTPDLNMLKQSVENNKEQLQGIMGANYNNIMPSILQVEAARRAETDRAKAHAKEQIKQQREENQLKYLVGLELNQIDINKLMLDPYLKTFGSGSKQWFLEEIKKRAKEKTEPPKNSNYTVWNQYHSKAQDGMLNENDVAAMYKAGANRQLTIGDMRAIFSLDRSMKKSEQTPLNRAIKDATRTLGRRILGGAYLYGGKPTVEKGAYDAQKALERQINAWKEENVTEDEIVSRISDPENKNYIIDNLAKEYAPTKEQIRQDKRERKARERGEVLVTPQGTPEVVQKGAAVQRKPGETPEEYLKRIGQ